MAMAAVLLSGHQLSWAQQATSSTQTSPRSDTAHTAPANVEFRLGQLTKGKGLTELKLSDGSLWLQEQPDLNRNDLASVEPRQTAQGQSYIRFAFAEPGSDKLEKISKEHGGKLLVVTINNELVAAPQIQQQMTKGVLDVPFATEAQAIDAARLIAGN